MNRIAVAAFFAAGLCVSAMAHSEPVEDPRETPIRFYRDHFGLTREQAIERIHLNDVAARINYPLSQIPGYAGWEGGRGPTFEHIILVTADGDPSRFMSIIPADLKQHTEFRRVRAFTALRNSETLMIAGAMIKQDVKFDLSFDSAADEYVLRAEDRKTLDRLARQIPPHLTRYVRTAVGPIADKEDGRRVFHPRNC